MLERFVVRKILGNWLGGEIYRDSITRKEQLKVLYRQDTDECVQSTANDLTLKLRLVHHFVYTIFTPKTRSTNMFRIRNYSFCGPILPIQRLTCPYLFWTICLEPP